MKSNVLKYSMSHCNFYLFIYLFFVADLAHCNKPNKKNKIKKTVSVK